LRLPVGGVLVAGVSAEGGELVGGTRIDPALRFALSSTTGTENGGQYGVELADHRLVGAYP
jgi:hypothetical protein